MEQIRSNGAVNARLKGNAMTQFSTKRRAKTLRTLAIGAALAVGSTTAVWNTVPPPIASAETSAPRPITHEPAEITTIPSQFPSQTPLPVPAASDSDASVDRGVIPYHEIAPRINEIMASSDRVSAQVVGQSTDGRDIYLVTVTSPETAAQTARQTELRDRIRNDAAAITEADLAEYKAPVWVNGNIHGNEWEGTDISLNSIAELASDQSDTTKQLLDEHRFYFTVSLNPDGRHDGTRRNPENFDANRDMITSATAESRVLRDLAAQIQPVFYIDLHGYTKVLQVEPTGPPHGEGYEYDLFIPHAYDMALRVEQDVVAANIPGNTYLGADGKPTTENTGKIKIPYRDIREGWDDWPPIFTPQYLTYYGAITNTVELPHGRTNDPAVNKENARINIEVGNVAMDSFIAYIGEHSDPVLANQVEVFRRGAAGEPKHDIPADVDPASVPEPNQWAEIWDETDVYTTTFPRAYVIPAGDGQRSDTNAAHVVTHLVHNNVRVEQASTEFTLGGITYPAGSYIVDMHQPLRGLAHSFLNAGQDISERVPEMYDISAWSIALLWGANVDAVGETTDGSSLPAREQVTEAAATGSIPEPGSYLELTPTGVNDYIAMNHLLAAGIPVSALDDGRLIIGPDQASYDAAASAVAEYGVTFTASDGTVLQEQGRGIAAPRIGYVGAPEERFALEQLGFTDLTEVSVAALDDGSATLSEIDVLWIGDTAELEITDGGGADTQLGEYFAANKPVAGEGEAVATLAQRYKVAEITAHSGTDYSNGIVRVSDDAAAPLFDDSLTTAFVYPAVWYSGLGENARVEQRYAETDTFVAGHWGAGAAEARAASGSGTSVADAAGQASVVTVNADGGGSRMVLLGTTVNFRTHPIGSYQWIGRSMEWLAPEGAAVAAPTPEATDPGATDPGASEPGDTEMAPAVPGASEASQPAPSAVADNANAPAEGVLPVTGAEMPLGTLGVIAALLTAGVTLGLRHQQQLRRVSAERDD